MWCHEDKNGTRKEWQESFKRSREGKKGGVTDTDGEPFQWGHGVGNDWLVGVDAGGINSY